MILTVMQSTHLLVEIYNKQEGITFQKRKKGKNKTKSSLMIRDIEMSFYFFATFC